MSYKVNSESVIDASRFIYPDNIKTVAGQNINVVGNVQISSGFYRKISEIALTGFEIPVISLVSFEFPQNCLFLNIRIYTTLTSSASFCTRFTTESRSIPESSSLLYGGYSTTASVTDNTATIRNLSGTNRFPLSRNLAGADHIDIFLTRSSDVIGYSSSQISGSFAQKIRGTISYNPTLNANIRNVDIFISNGMTFPITSATTFQSYGLFNA